MDWKKKTMIFYSIGGLVLGILAGILTVKNAVEKEQEVDLSLKNGVKVGLVAMEGLKKMVIK